MLNSEAQKIEERGCLVISRTLHERLIRCFMRYTARKEQLGEEFGSADVGRDDRKMDSGRNGRKTARTVDPLKCLDSQDLSRFLRFRRLSYHCDGTRQLQHRGSKSNFLTKL